MRQEGSQERQEVETRASLVLEQGEQVPFVGYKNNPDLQEVQLPACMQVWQSDMQARHLGMPAAEVSLKNPGSVQSVHTPSTVSARPWSQLVQTALSPPQVRQLELHVEQVKSSNSL